MGGDYSRVTFDPADAFAGVLKQQGRVSLDAEFNEYVELTDRHWRAETLEVIGPCGVPHAVPREPAGTPPEPFLIRLHASGTSSISPTGTISPTSAFVPTGTSSPGGAVLGTIPPTDPALTIGRGRAYVDGILAECRGDTATLEADVRLGERRGTTPLPYAKQPFHYGADFPVLSADPTKTDLVYLDVWEREVTAVEDVELLENALGGPDTATRLQVAWQVKVLPNVGAIGCADDQSIWAGKRGNAWLTSRAAAGAAGPDPCIITPGGGFTGLENRLYRVEIHKGGSLATASFKWSRDNASLVARVVSITKASTTGWSDIIVASTGRDPGLRFEPDYGIELLDDWVEFGARDRGTGGSIAKIKEVDHVNGRITVDQDWSTFALVSGRNPRVRRWDVKGVGQDAVRETKPAETPIELEAGITIEFGPDDAQTKVHAGDYWVFAARTANGKIDELNRAPPRGVTHHYCHLALVHRAAVPPAPVVEDCRRAFPPLVDIHAEDVSVSDTCLLGVATLQDVFDEQCGARVLRYVSGDGQEGAPGAVLPGELLVGVEDGFGRPKSGVTVEFTVTAGGGSVTAPPITTDVNGLAQCTWTLGTAAGENEVKAQLPGGTRLPVVFHAMAEVQGATEQLPQVVGISWENDRGLRRSQFNAGLRVTFSEEMHPQTLTPDTFIVTIELPFDDVRQAPGAMLRYRGHHELIVSGSVTGSPDGRTWTFHPVNVPAPVLAAWLAAETTGPATGTLQGTVEDVATGAALANAQVTLTDTNTGATRNAVTNNQGAYAFNSVPAGNYELQVRLIGYSVVRLDDIPLLGDQMLTIDVPLGPNAGLPKIPRDQHDPDRLRCRVKLKAHAILALKTLRPLDGDVFGSVRSDHTTDLLLPSGDGRRGGDCDSWFWLMELRIRPTGTIPTGTIPTGTIPTGTIPTGTIPTGTIPTGTIPTGTIPTGTIPTGTIPTGTIPTGTIPTGPIPTGPRPTGPFLTGLGTIPIGGATEAIRVTPALQPSLFDPAGFPGRRVNEVGGIGAAFARALEANGITNLAALASMQPAELARVLGVSEVRAIAMIDEARGLLRP